VKAGDAVTRTITMTADDLERAAEIAGDPALVAEGRALGDWLFGRSNTMPTSWVRHRVRQADQQGAASVTPRGARDSA
jgi:hypothetical protein